MVEQAVGAKLPSTVLKPVASFASRPAPLTPEAASTMRLFGLTSPGRPAASARGSPRSGSSRLRRPLSRHGSPRGSAPECRRRTRRAGSEPRAHRRTSAHRSPHRRAGNRRRDRRTGCRDRGSQVRSPGCDHGGARRRRDRRPPARRHRTSRISRLHKPARDADAPPPRCARPCFRRTVSLRAAQGARREGAEARRRHSPRLPGLLSESRAALSTHLHKHAITCIRMSMSELKERRQKAMADLIRANALGSQDEVATRLASLGFEVTQATVSRDLEQLGALKVRREGRISYALPEQLNAGTAAPPRLGSVLRDWVRSIDLAATIAVLEDSARFSASRRRRAGRIRDSRDRRHDLRRRYHLRRLPKRRRRGGTCGQAQGAIGGAASVDQGVTSRIADLPGRSCTPR